MENLDESQGDGTDLPQVHKAPGRWLDPVGILEGALALYLLVYQCGMCQDWKSASSRDDTFPSLGNYSYLLCQIELNWKKNKNKK